MLARLGNVLYWAACILSAAILVLGFTFWGSNEPNVFVVFAMVPAAIIWAVGRALRYILADT